MSNGEGRKVYCTNCGVEAGVDSSFCVSCGTQLGPASQTSEDSDAEHEVRRISGDTAAHGTSSATQHDDSSVAQAKTNKNPITGALKRAANTWKEDFRSQFNQPLEDTRNEFHKESIEDETVADSEPHREVNPDRMAIAFSPTEALDRATEHMVSYTGRPDFTVANRTSNSVTFSSYKRPNLFIAPLFLIPAAVYYFAEPPTFSDYLGSGQTVPNPNFNFVILLFLTIPMFIYFMVGGKHVQSTLTAISLPSGSRLSISGESPVGHELLREWLNTLPKIPSFGSQPHEYTGQQYSATEKDGYDLAALGIPEKIRKLAELRDSGILSDEEFKAKKSQLLDQM